MIIDQYEQAKKKSNAPFYLFNVTMQNHSGYDQDFDNLDMPISIEEKCDDPELKRYLNLIHHSDTAILNAELSDWPDRIIPDRH